MTIYELNYQFTQLAALAEDPDVTAEELEQAIAEVGGRIDEFVDNATRAIANLQGDIDGVKKEVDRLTAKRKNLEAKVAAFKVQIFRAMEMAGTRKIKTGLFDVSIAKNGGKAPVILTCDPDQVPDSLCRFRREIDTDALRKYIEETGDVSYARIGERGESLRIK